MSEPRLPDWLAQHHRDRPDELALSVSDERLSWAELYDRADRLARQLAGQGVGPGGRVAMLLSNGRPFVELVYALMRLRAVLVPLNVRLTAAELNWQLTDVGAGWLLTDHRRLELAQAAAAGLPQLQLLEVAATGPTLGDLAEADYPAPQKYVADELHTIIYSSGTTGRPKGVRLTYGNHFFNAQASYQNLPIGPTDNWLAVLPLFHVGGLAIILRGLFYGMPVTVHDGFDSVAVNRRLDAGDVTIISVVTNMLSRLLDERHDRLYPASLRCILIGGGPVPAPLLERCARIGVPVVQTYGMTETASQSVTLAPQDALRKLGSAGLPLPGVELRIEPTDPLNLEPDGIGEIVLRGPNITPGYHNRPEATALAWRGGWFHTGDLGRVDNEGFLYVLDRRDDLIISGGENVYPAEVEAVLLGHPTVEEAGVVGQPDARWGQTVLAYVKLRPNHSATEADLLEYCTPRLARYKIPTAIRFVVESLPRNASGKLLRRTLREGSQKS